MRWYGPAQIKPKPTETLGQLRGLNQKATEGDKMRGNSYAGLSAGMPLDATSAESTKEAPAGFFNPAG